jgi:23S rRNA-/tRNA-specific pseudouridylate synthase
MRGTIKQYRKRRDDEPPAAPKALAPAAPNALAPAAPHVAAPAAPQAARTHFRVLARFPAQDAAPQESSGDAAETLRFPTALLCATLHTGRWHQIRRHLSNLGHHVLGDSQHGKLRYNGPARDALGLHRLFLHAASVRIAFDAPAAAAAGLPPGAPLAVVSPLPRELADAAARLPGWERAAQVLRAQGLLPEAEAGG